MKLNLLNDTNFGVVILCPDFNPSGLRYTVKYLNIDFPGIPVVAMTGCDTHQEDFEVLSKCCRVSRGGKTITSLIDFGVNHIQRDWLFFIMAGGRLRPNTFKKFAYFATAERDVLFPVVDNKYLFDEASISGLLINRAAFTEVGCFGDFHDNMRESKLWWGGAAIKKQYKFKALVGAKMI